MVATLIGRFPSAVWRVVEEYRHWQGPAPNPRHPRVEKTAVDWDQLKRNRTVTNNNAVGFFKQQIWKLVIKSFYIILTLCKQMDIEISQFVLLLLKVLIQGVTK